MDTEVGLHYVFLDTEMLLLVKRKQNEVFYSRRLSVVTNMLF
jgi:hypothetical protein